MEEQPHTNWQNELDKTAFKYHSLVLWVALILDPIWAIGDYFTIPEHFVDFLIFRLVVSVACLITYFYRNQFIEKPWVLAFIPFIGIAVQNAYMYSVMEIPELEKHTFAFIALFIGAGMFVLWKRIYSIIVVTLTIVASIICFIIFSPLQLGDILINGGMLTFTVAIFTILLIDTRTRLTKREIISRLALEASNKELEAKNLIIAEHNKDIRDSITYAKRIQEASLPKLDQIKILLPEIFIYYKPKDIVSGDFYWSAQVNTTPLDGSPGEKVITLAVVDCTGHGVPGALMSSIGSAILNQSIKSPKVNSPAEALDFLNQQLHSSLKDIRDGMDVSFVAINFNALTLQYAGANNPLYIVRDKKLVELKADRQAIGNDVDEAHMKKFTNQNYVLHKNDMIYLFTDGYADQFGNGPDAKQKTKAILSDENTSEKVITETIFSMLKGKKYGTKRFQQLLIDNSHLPVDEQKDVLVKAHKEWKGDLEQIDDICVIGIRI